jgi:DNA-directed RNA polymerase specialized sigma24 family protein
MTDDPSRPEDTLIARIADGDRDAFALLYRQYRPDVYRFAAHISGSSAVAEDVVHDVFIAVIEDASRYRPGQSGVLPWLLGIARNHVRRWRHRRPVCPLPGDDTEAGRRLAGPAIELGKMVPPDLQILVMTDRTDPRVGHSTYWLLKIVRSDPDPALFQVPADYTVSPPKWTTTRRKGG